MALNKTNVYWLLQIGGWFIYASFQIVSSFLAGTVTPQRLVFLLFEAFLCLMVTHQFRNLLIKRKWLLFSMPKLVPSVLVTIFIMGVLVYFLRIPVNILLGRFV